MKPNKTIQLSRCSSINLSIGSEVCGQQLVHDQYRQAYGIAGLDDSPDSLMIDALPPNVPTPQGWDNLECSQFLGDCARSRLQHRPAGTVLQLLPDNATPSVGPVCRAARRRFC